MRDVLVQHYVSCRTLIVTNRCKWIPLPDKYDSKLDEDQYSIASNVVE